MLPNYNPGLRSFNYYTASQSPYHIWFCELGFPELDITQYEDGEWEIIEYQNSPIIPCLTKFKTVLGKLRNVEITFSFIKRYVEQCNPMSTYFWERLEQEEREKDREFEQRERAAVDRAEQATKLIVNNPEMMERIARRGLGELDLLEIRRNIPDYMFR